MTEQIYIDGQLMELDGRSVTVQLIYQSPILVDFQQVMSNRTTQVQLPATDANLKAVGYTGTQAVSDFAYRRHKVIYKRDGVQLLNGNAVLLSINNGSIMLCFTWGNVTGMKSLFEISLRDVVLPAGYRYSSYAPTAADTKFTLNKIDFGGKRHGIGLATRVLLAAIETQCGVTGLQALADADDGYDYFLALTGRNGDTTTKALQGAYYGVPTARVWEVAYLFDITTLIAHGDDAHGYLNEYGIMDVSGFNELRVVFKGAFYKSQYMTVGGSHVMRLVMDDGNGWDYGGGVTIATPVQIGSQGGTPTMRYTCDFDQTVDVSRAERICIAIGADIGLNTATLSNVTLTDAVLIPDPDQPEEVIYESHLSLSPRLAYPVAQNLPDITCGQFVKNLLWLHGMFAYSRDGKMLSLIDLNTLAAGKAQAVDWTRKVVFERSWPEEYKTTMTDTAQCNKFCWKEADDYDAGEYEGVITTDDATIEQERVYCKSDLGIAPSNKIPVWMDNEGEWDYVGDGSPVRLLRGKTVGTAQYDKRLNWSWILANRYQPLADILHRPELLKVRAVLTTYDLYKLDLTVPVYLQQTGRYYLIRTLTVKDGEEAEAELIKI